MVKFLAERDIRGGGNEAPTSIPKYPRKEFFVFHPELLLKHAPSKWVRSSLAAGSLFAFASSGFLQMCSKNTDMSRGPSSIEENETESKKIREVKKEQVNIAPLFIHGDGFGATGCIVISPPAFLSEAEAFEIIYSALKKENIEVDQKDWLLQGFYTEDSIAGIKDMDTESRKEIQAWLKKQYGYKLRRHPFYLDIYNSKLNLGIKFISGINYYRLGGSISTGSVQFYDMIGLAQEMREKLQECQRVNAAIFYDPLPSCRGRIPMKCREAAGRLLSEQVADFVKWFSENFSSPK